MKREFLTYVVLQVIACPGNRKGKEVQGQLEGLRLHRAATYNAHLT